MRFFTFGSLLLVLLLSTPGLAQLETGESSVQPPKIETFYDKNKDLTTVRLAPLQVSGEKDKYYSLNYAASFSYHGQSPRKPDAIDFELQSIVKARTLKIDLYVVFVVDGETIFLSSNRTARKNPVPGRRWVGERLVFRMPYEALSRIISARKFDIRLDSVTFAFGDVQLAALRQFWKHVNLAH